MRILATNYSSSLNSITTYKNNLILLLLSSQQGRAAPPNTSNPNPNPQPRHPETHMGIPPTFRRECPLFPAQGRYPNKFAQGNRSAPIQN